MHQQKCPQNAAPSWGQGRTPMLMPCTTLLTFELCRPRKPAPPHTGHTQPAEPPSSPVFRVRRSAVDCFAQEATPEGGTRTESTRAPTPTLCPFPTHTHTRPPAHTHTAHAHPHVHTQVLEQSRVGSIRRSVTRSLWTGRTGKKRNKARKSAGRGLFVRGVRKGGGGSYTTPSATGGGASFPRLQLLSAAARTAF